MTAQNSTSTTCRSRGHRAPSALFIGCLVLLSLFGFIVAFTRDSGALHTSEWTSVEVSQGDTLAELVYKYAPKEREDVAVLAIEKRNGLKSALIHPGQVLEVPVDSLK